MTQNTKISAQTLAFYMKNNFDRHSAFEKIFKIALRAEGSVISDDYATEMIKQLRNYAIANDGRMPPSFNQSAMRRLYLNLKAKKVDVSPRLEELLLFTMDKLKMDAEVADLCQGKEQQTDVHTYYMSEALLRM